MAISFGATVFTVGVFVPVVFLGVHRTLLFLKLWWELNGSQAESLMQLKLSSVNWSFTSLLNHQFHIPVFLSFLLTSGLSSVFLVWESMQKRNSDYLFLLGCFLSFLMMPLSFPYTILFLLPLFMASYSLRNQSMVHQICFYEPFLVSVFATYDTLGAVFYREYFVNWRFFSFSLLPLSFFLIQIRREGLEAKPF